VETLRKRIEADLKTMYDKLSLSSLDRNYPGQVLRNIGASAGANAMAIEKHVNKLYVEKMNRETEEWRNEVDRLPPQMILEWMELPLRGGQNEGGVYVAKALSGGMSAKDVFDSLTWDFDRQSIFRKEQTIVATTVLYYQTSDDAVKELLREFFDKVRDYDLPILNQVECAQLRLTRKFFVLSVYPEMRKRIDAELKNAPELVRLVRPPTVIDGTYAAELELHARSFDELKRQPDEALQHALPLLLKLEADVEEEFNEACGKLGGNETHIGGFEFFGKGGHHYAFKNILKNSNLEPDDVSPA
jgi:hypothetical protein